MREALARSDNDFVLSEPRQRGGRRPAGTAGFLLAVLRFAYKAAAYPNRVAAALLIIVLIAIMFNALVLQRSPHPAPLFGRTIALPPSRPAAQTASQPPVPVERPTRELAREPAAASEPEAAKPARDPIADLLKTGGAPHPAVVNMHHHANPEAASEAKPAPSRDPISQLLKAQSPASESGRETRQESARQETARQEAAKQEAGKQEPSRTVASAQRALVKLGFVLKPDGVNGAATRQAIEQFERDHGLPVKGELTPKVLRELAARSGQTIE